MIEAGCPAISGTGLTLADGLSWVVDNVDRAGAGIVDELGRIMGFRAVCGRSRILRFSKSEQGSARLGRARLDLRAAGQVVDAVFHPAPNRDLFVDQLRRVAAVMAASSESRGGVLVHGALVARGDAGVLLLAPGGGGKTTTSAKMRPPWRVLCDDMTLVVRSADGQFRAHPWPSWTRFMFGGPGGSWRVSESVTVEALACLVKSSRDGVERVGAGRASCLLVEAAEQAWHGIELGSGPHERRRRFDNICILASGTTAFRLDLRLAGDPQELLDTMLDPVEAS